MDLENLGPEARAERYRGLARAQMDLAAKAAEPDMRAVCLELAAMWTRLAEAAERQRTSPLDVGQFDWQDRASA